MQQHFFARALIAFSGLCSSLAIQGLLGSGIALAETPPTIVNAVWRANTEKLIIKGSAAHKDSLVAVMDAQSGLILGEAVSNGRKLWRLVLQSPALVPCAVRAEAAGYSDVKSVKGAASDCMSTASSSDDEEAIQDGLAALPTLEFKGTEWFVSSGGTGSGSEAQPLGSIQQALELAQAGDGITLLPGTYNEALTTRRHGSANKPIVLQARDGLGSVTITNRGRVLSVEHAHHHFSQIVFAGQYGDSDLIKVRTEATGWLLYNSEVKESSRDCIDMESPEDVAIRESTIHHCLNAANGRTDAHGIVGGSVRGLLIQNTKIHSFSGDAFQIDAGRSSPGWDNVVIDGCEFWLAPLPQAVNGFAAGVVPGENAVDTKVREGYRPKITIRNSSFWGYQNGLISNMSALNLKESIDASINAVTIYDSDIAFRLRYPATVKITNAIVHSTNRAVRYEDNIAEVKISHSTFGKGINTFFQRASSSATTFDIRNSLFLSSSFPAEVNTSRNLVVRESAFNGANIHDYHLAIFSPAVDSAIAPVTSTDRFGTKRPLGNGHDMGAIESR